MGVDWNLRLAETTADSLGRRDSCPLYKETSRPVPWRRCLFKVRLMKKLVASILCVALALVAAPLNLIAQTGEISGVAQLEGKPIPNTSVRLRNVNNGQLAGTTTTNAAGEFSFTGLPAGDFAVEIVSANGTILGTSAVTLTAATMVVANLTIGASAAAVAAAGGAGVVLGTTAAVAGVGAGLGTGVIVAGVVAAGLGVGGLAVALNDSSPSQ